MPPADPAPSAKSQPPAKPAPPGKPPRPAASMPGGGEPLIAGRYIVDPKRPLPGAGGGLRAFAATDQRDSRVGLMALQVAPGAPPRPHPFIALSDFVDPRMLVPLGYGPGPGPDGQPGWYVICVAPPGPPLWPEGTEAIRPWTDAELVTRVLRPVTAVLQMLEARRLTHRAIRPGNLFVDASKGGQVVVGCAWATPPAFAQPAVFEPPYMGMCAPSARGAGDIADDVYALGVTLLSLATGRVPLAGLDADAVVRRKLEVGCFQALAGDRRLSPMIADLASGMLAQAPEHRPTPALLADPSAARARRLAARPSRRAPRALLVGDQAVFDARSLAFAIARQPEVGATLVRTGVADHWLRRVLGDLTLAARIEEVQRSRNAESGADQSADARLVLNAVALLDPLAPLCWRGVALWPDALGAALVAEPLDPVARARIEEIVQQEILGTWGRRVADRCDPTALQQEGRQLRALLRLRGWAGGVPRLDYTLNALLHCRGKLVADRMVTRPRELLLALEAVSARPEARALPPVDREIAAFIAARMEGRYDKQIAALGDAAEPARMVLAQIRVLGDLQASVKAPPLPGLAAWLAELAAPAMELWHNRETRAERKRAVAEVAPTGDLAALLGVIDHQDTRRADETGHATAVEQVRVLDAKIERLRVGARERSETARKLGQETATAFGLAALVASVIAALLR